MHDKLTLFTESNFVNIFTTAFSIEPEEVLKYDTELAEECIDESLPTQMAKQFCVIYDVNWSEAFSQAKQHFVDDKEDEEIIKDIATLTQV